MGERFNFSPGAVHLSLKIIAHIKSFSFDYMSSITKIKQREFFEIYGR
jgi:hypothetical protein